MRRIKFVIEYNGMDYVGFQKQENLKSIQEDLENALSKSLQEKIDVVASGRTDAGVSAMGQVVHFDTASDLNVDKIKYATNFYLPETIKIVDALIVDNDFHARFSAKKKTYIYRMYFADYESPLLNSTHLKLWHNIDVESMKKACLYFIGTFDFFGFCMPNPQINNYVRTIYDCKIVQRDNVLEFSITGNAFLHKMVRIIIGTIIKIGQRQIKLENLKDIILSKDRKKAGATAPAYPLILKNVEY